MEKRKKDRKRNEILKRVRFKVIDGLLPDVLQVLERAYFWRHPKQLILGCLPAPSLPSEQLQPIELLPFVGPQIRRLYQQALIAKPKDVRVWHRQFDQLFLQRPTWMQVTFQSQSFGINLSSPVWKC